MEGDYWPPLVPPYALFECRYPELPTWSQDSIIYHIRIVNHTSKLLILILNIGQNFSWSIQSLYLFLFKILFTSKYILRFMMQFKSDDTCRARSIHYRKVVFAARNFVHSNEIVQNISRGHALNSLIYPDNNM